MDKMNFDELDGPKEHWSKKVFLDRGFKISDVARALGLSYPYVSGMLTGSTKISNETEERLKKLVNYVIKNYEPVL